MRPLAVFVILACRVSGGLARRVSGVLTRRGSVVLARCVSVIRIDGCRHASRSTRRTHGVGEVTNGLVRPDGGACPLAPRGTYRGVSAGRGKVTGVTHDERTRVQGWLQGLCSSVPAWAVRTLHGVPKRYKFARERERGEAGAPCQPARASTFRAPAVFAFDRPKESNIEGGREGGEEARRARRAAGREMVVLNLPLALSNIGGVPNRKLKIAQITAYGPRLRTFEHSCPEGVLTGGQPGAGSNVGDA
ncbi:hypothetical protein DFH09DRAFT_1447706 [Mycena vulgaris]|nr:hypothetical protein DFH09DRAFT_1447706 [Mycena vulgaris]